MLVTTVLQAFPIRSSGHLIDMKRRLTDELLRILITKSKTQLIEMSQQFKPYPLGTHVETPVVSEL